MWCSQNHISLSKNIVSACFIHVVNNKIETKLKSTIELSPSRIKMFLTGGLLRWNITPQREARYY